MDNSSELIIGSHVKMGSPLYFKGSVLEAISYGSSALMFYTGAPQNNIRTPIENCKIPEAIELAKQNGINPINFVCHAPYLINLGNIKNDYIYNLSLEMLINEINRCHEFGCNKLVLHPGASLKEDRITCLNSVADGINKAISITNNDVIVALETMAGKGSELGITFEEISYIISKIENKNRIGVCLDTCHINDGGYDISDFDNILRKFDEIIGLKYLKVIHLNDSKNPMGSHKDRHENIGFGYIGFDTLVKIAHHPLLTNIPKILETPYVNEKAPYKEEIQMIKEKQFNENCFQKIN